MGVEFRNGVNFDAIYCTTNESKYLQIMENNIWRDPLWKKTSFFKTLIKILRSSKDAKKGFVVW